jgi:hypothetical protein
MPGKCVRQNIGILREIGDCTFRPGAIFYFAGFQTVRVFSLKKSAECRKRGKSRSVFGDIYRGFVAFRSFPISLLGGPADELHCECRGLAKKESPNAHCQQCPQKNAGKAA